MRQEDKLQTSFCFLKSFIKGRSNLILICFGRPRVGHTIKANCTTFQAVDPDIWSILTF